ncbi:MAG: DUF262 domain-containing protein, partial [bacterium]
MKSELGAQPATLRELLAEKRRYVSPLFQRRYVWGTPEMDRLWAAIDEILEAEESSRFLGALVLEVRSPAKSFQAADLWIVDGQQRLTTLYLILLRIAVEAELAGLTSFSNELFDTYLFNRQGSSRAHSPKIHPTLFDYAQFREAFAGLNTINPSLPAPHGSSTGALSKAVQNISKEIRKRCFVGKQLDQELATRLVQAILEEFKFVEITLGDDDDAHQVFDSLNSAGVRLEHKDLVRNVVFSKVADDPLLAESIYNGRWVPLETKLGTRFGSFFYPFGLIMKSSITKSTLMSALKHRWVDKLPEEIIADLETYVAEFNALTSDDKSDRDYFSDSNTVNEQLHRLHRMPVPTVTFPYLLRLLHGFKEETLTEQATVDSMLLLESFLVR